MNRRWLALLLPWLALLPMALARRQLQAAPDAIFNVNTTADAPDNNIGNGVGGTALGPNTCTLRAAMQEANANADNINVPAGTYVLTGNGIAEDTGLGGDLDIR